MRRRAYVREHTSAVVLVLLGVAALVVVGERSGLRAARVSQVSARRNRGRGDTPDRGVEEDQS